MKYIKPKDLKGKYNLEIDIKNTVPFEYFYKEIKGQVYRFYRINKGEWEVEKTPFDHIPYSFWKQS